MIQQLSEFAVKHPWLRKAAVSIPGIRSLAWRLVAGEDLDSGAAAVRALNARGILATLSQAGNHVRTERDAVAAADEAIAALRRIHADGLDANVSVKLTQLGLDVRDDLCVAQIRRVVECAVEVKSFVRIDAEESVYTDRTLQIFDELRAAYGRDTVGIVVQSYLKHRGEDLRRLVGAGARVRLVKGGYWEPAAVVYRKQADIEGAFLKDVEFLLAHGRHPAIATHDENAIARAQRLAEELRLDKRTFEFQLMYGVRSDLQEAAARAGYTVRCYVPYGRRGALQRMVEQLRGNRRGPTVQ
jgi:proline dehydrogenase